MGAETGDLAGGIEKRRLVCTEECQCESGERSFRAKLRNLSGEGAFIRTGDPFSLGEEMFVRFRVAERRVEVAAIVRHSELGYGMGVQFLEIQPKHREALHDYLTSLLGRLGTAAYSRARRTPRITHSALVRIRGHTANGKRLAGTAETVDVSDIGARLLMSERVNPGELLALQVVSDGGSSWAQLRIVWQGREGTPVHDHIGLEQALVDLWGIHKLSDE